MNTQQFVLTTEHQSVKHTKRKKCIYLLLYAAAIQAAQSNCNRSMGLRSVTGGTFSENWRIEREQKTTPGTNVTTSFNI